jgi:O-antigen/teichoic acid export membrane protein
VSGKTRRDLLIGFGSQLAFKGLGFVTLAVMARNLSQADYGKLMFALTLCGVTVLATDLGASTDLVRRVAADPAGARRRLGRVLSARGPLIAAYLVLICAWAALTKPDALAVVAAIAVYSVLKDLYRSYASLFLGLHHVEYSVAAYGIKLLFLVIAVTVGAAVDGGLAWMTGAHVASGVILLVVAALIARTRVGPVRLRPPGRLMRRVFAQSIWLFGASIMGSAHLGAGTLILGYRAPYQQVAVYEAAARLLEASQFMVRPLTLILFPVSAVLASRRDWSELRRLMHRMFGGIILVGIAAWGVVSAIASPLIRVVYTGSYDESAAILRILYLSVPGLYAATVAVFVASSLNRERAAVMIVGSGVALNVGINLMVVPRIGATGAAWATVASQTLTALALMAYTYRGVAAAPAAVPVHAPPMVPEMELGGD